MPTTTEHPLKLQLSVLSRRQAHAHLQTHFQTASSRPQLLVAVARLSHTDLHTELELQLRRQARDQLLTRYARVSDIARCASIVYADAAARHAVQHASVLIHLARSALDIGGTRAHRLSRRVWRSVWRVCRASTSGCSAEVAVAALEGGACFADDDSRFRDWVSAVVSELTAEQLPRFLRAVLAGLATEKSGSDRVQWLAGLVVDVFGRVRSCEALLPVLEVMHAEYAQICMRVLSAMRTAISRRVKMGHCHLAMLFTLLRSASCEKDRTAVHDILRRLLRNDAADSVAYQTGVVASASSSACSDVRQAVWIRCVTLAEMVCRSDCIADFLESQMWTTDTRLRGAAQKLLVQVFVWIAPCRERILESILAAISASAPPSYVLESFALLFEALTDDASSVYILMEFKSALTNWFGFVQFMSPHVDCRIVNAIVPVAVMTPSLHDDLMLFLRKISTSRSRKLQRVACSAFLTVIAQRNVPDDTVAEVCDTLTMMIKASDMYVRSHLISLLLNLAKPAASFSARVTRLFDCVLERIWIMGTEHDPSQPSSETRMNFTKCLHEFHAETQPRDPYPLLLHFCSQLRVRNKKADAFLCNLIHYLSDPNGAVRDACSLHEMCDASVCSRIAFLSTLFETVISIQIDSLSDFVTPYAFTLILRDYLLPKHKQTRQSESRGVAPTEIGEQLLQTMTSREVALSGLEGVKLQSWVDGGVNGIESLLSILRKLEQCEENLATVVVRSELLHVVLSSFTVNERNDTRAATVADIVKSIDVIIACFISSCPPVDSAVNSTLTSACDRTDKMVSDDNRTINDRLQEAFPESMHRLVADNEAKEALVESHLRKTSTSLRLSIRQCALQLVVKIVTTDGSINAWKVVQRMMARESRCGSQPKASEAVDMHVCVMQDLTRLLRIEFENSLTTRLTIAYLEVMGCLLDRDNDGDEGMAVRSIVKDSMLGLLREYCIAHSRVLRPMVGLVFKTCERDDGVRFACDVIEWLGNDDVLCGDESRQLHVSQFDEDIIAEAVDWERADADADADADVSTGFGDEGCVRSRVEEDAMVGNAVKGLCLNESNEAAVVAMTVCVAYVESMLSEILEEAGDILAENESIANALRTCCAFFESDYATRHEPRWPLVLRRKGVKIVHMLCETSQVMLRQIRDASEKNVGGWMMEMLPRIVTLLYTNACVDSLQHSVISRRGCNIETVEVAIANLQTASANDEKVKELHASLLRICAKRRNGSSVEDGEEEVRAAIYPRKKQRVRSRNRHIDEWLHGEDGDDNYADLEDFIAPLDEA